MPALFERRFLFACGTCLMCLTLVPQAAGRASAACSKAARDTCEKLISTRVA
jgi:hypothetical protein